MENAVLEIRNLCKSYGDKQVVNSENFTVYAGDILGFIDPMVQVKVHLST